MKISKIEYIPIRPKSGCLGFVSFVIDEELYVASVAVYSRLGGGIRLVWPKINNNGNQFATIHPITQDLAQKIESVVEEHVQKLLPI